MSTTLKLPPPDLHEIDLEIVELPVERLFRISRHESGEPYFGKSAGNRFDDNSHPPARRFGTCYLGVSLCGAIAEVVRGVDSRRRRTCDLRSTPASMLPSLPCTFAGNEGNCYGLFRLEV